MKIMQLLFNTEGYLLL